MTRPERLRAMAESDPEGFVSLMYDLTLSPARLDAMQRLDDAGLAEVCEGHATELEVGSALHDLLTQVAARLRRAGGGPCL